MKKNLENWVIVLDCTKSMSKEDFQTKRFQTALNGLKIFIEEKNITLQKIWVSLILYNKKVSVVSELTDDIPFIINFLSKKKFKKLCIPTGSTDVLDSALINAIDILAHQIQNISGFKNCILLISDDDNLEISDEIQDRITGLKISINIITFSHEKNITSKKNDLKTQHFTTKQEFLEGMKKLASLDKKENNTAQNFSELMLEHKKKKNTIIWKKSP